MMIKIKSTYKAGKFTVLVLSEPLPNSRYTKVKISGIEYIPEIVYDVNNEIGIMTEASLIGETIEFV